MSEIRFTTKTLLTATTGFAVNLISAPTERSRHHEPHKQSTKLKHFVHFHWVGVLVTGSTHHPGISQRNKECQQTITELPASLSRTRSTNQPPQSIATFQCPPAAAARGFNEQLNDAIGWLRWLVDLFNRILWTRRHDTLYSCAVATVG